MPIIATYNPDEPTDMEKRLLASLVFLTDMDQTEKEDMMMRINQCMDYKEFEKLQYQLEVREQSIHEIQNPSQKDISRHIMRIV